MRRVPLKPVSFLLRIHEETFDTETKIPELFDTGNTGNFQYALSLRKSYYDLESHSTTLSLGHGSRFLAWHVLQVVTYTVVFPLGLSEAVLVFPLTARLTLHLLCGYLSSISLLLFLWLITFALVVIHACR